MDSQMRVKPCYHATMAKNLTVRLDDDLASDTEALARAEGKSLNETVKQALAEAVQRRREDPKFKARVKRIIEEDREPPTLQRVTKIELAESALHAPTAGFGETEFYPDFIDKAAVLLVRLAKNHPLPDGNPRRMGVAAPVRRDQRLEVADNTERRR